jgi:hypothetical protein
MSIGPPAATPTTMRTGRVGCDTRHGGQRDSASCQMEKSTPGNFHRSPPVSIKL